jgi:hypothetical protein
MMMKMMVVSRRQIESTRPDSSNRFNASVQQYNPIMAGKLTTSTYNKLVQFEIFDSWGGCWLIEQQDVVVFFFWGLAGDSSGR